MEKGVLAVISGFSGAGKGTIVGKLLERYSDYVVSISATTRRPRVGESEGVHYFFISKDEFEEKIERGDFLEYAKYVDNYYGTPKDYVNKMLDEGKNVILEIEMQGGLQVKKAFPEAKLIFINITGMEELKNRLIKRGTETEEEINKRLSRAEEEVKYINDYDYVVINDNLEKAVAEVDEIIRGKKL